MPIKQTLVHNLNNTSDYVQPLVKNRLAVCLAVLLVPQFSFAGPPIPFGSSSCPSGFTCEINVESTGMSQRILTDGNGTSYFQVTIQDGQTNNGGSFFYDSFVDGSNNSTQGGIAAFMDINQTGTHNLSYSTTLNLGWANTGGGPAIDISQTIQDTDNGIGMDYTFNYKQRQDNNGNTSGFFYDIYQRVTNSSGTGSNDIHTFALRRAAGDYVNKGSISLSGSGGGGGGGGGGMMKASAGSSTGTTTTLQSAFVVDPNGYGTDGTIATAQGDPLTGDPQTQPADGTVYGPDGYIPPQFDNTFSGAGNVTESVTNSNTSTVTHVSTDNYGNSTGNIDSFGNASGPAAPTSEVYVSSGSMMGMGDTGGPSGGTVSWNTGDEVQAIWIGQSCPGCAMSGGMMGGGSSGVFSFHQYENLSSGSSAATRSISRSDPFAWKTDPFGAAPSL